MSRRGVPFAIVGFSIGAVAGLRALTAPMAVSWAARLGWIDVRRSWARLLGRGPTPWILTALALAELVNDKSPKTPRRTAAPSFAFRLLSGAFCGAALATGSDRAALVGAALGAAGAVAGTLGGYQARTRLVEKLDVRDVAVALPEDGLAVGGGLLVASALR
ncbi:MAG TPA: DUF4126 family protein [Polyangia bacterium]